MNGKRIDNREFDQLRKVNIKRNFIKYPEGSCLIELGNTKVICNASVEESVPDFLRNTGEGWVTAEYRMLPRSTHTRMKRDKVSGRNMEIQRLIGRCLRSVVDLKKIGERSIKIDCDVIQADGGTRVASIIGGFIALVDSLNGLYKQKKIYEISINDFLGAVSVGILEGNYLLDLGYEEDSTVDVDLNIVMKGNGEFVELQGAAEQGTFSHKDLNELIILGKKGIDEIIDMQRKIFKDVLPNL